MAKNHPSDANSSAENSTKTRNKGGRPKKSDAEKREIKHEVYVSKNEEAFLQKMVESTGVSIAELFRSGLFGKAIRIGKARAASGELMELLTDFKKKSSLIKLLAQRERDFTTQEKEVLLGSSSSMRITVERLQRYVFASLDKAEDFVVLNEMLEQLKEIREDVKEREKPQLTDYKKLDKIVEKLETWFKKHHQYLTLS
ncbi:hypothetical protein [Xanthocytophaga flava]|uniref:hypothetical protein n=1 Tax=Xanthocytophaga flava TaxID=3048013 RepID=UPI0028D772BC|nr:hypothetical protein [Xanthocytophaga flavus]MDJ1470250.1 hypothetical protein [Xanthocytophaga flavus]